jgi:YD repeat-containing protein
MLQNAKVGRVIGELSPTLDSFQWPDGHSDTFKFSVTSAMDAALAVTLAGAQATNYTWDPSGHILSDNDWQYTVSGTLPDSRLPALSRTNAQGQSESISITTKTGDVVQQDGNGAISALSTGQLP